MMYYGITVMTTTTTTYVTFHFFHKRPISPLNDVYIWLLNSTIHKWHSAVQITVSCSDKLSGWVTVISGEHPDSAHQLQNPCVEAPIWVQNHMNIII